MFNEGILDREMRGTAQRVSVTDNQGYATYKTFEELEGVHGYEWRYFDTVGAKEFTLPFPIKGLIMVEISGRIQVKDENYTFPTSSKIDIKTPLVKGERLGLLFDVVSYAPFGVTGMSVPFFGSGLWIKLFGRGFTNTNRVQIGTESYIQYRVISDTELEILPHSSMQYYINPAPTYANGGYEAVNVPITVSIAANGTTRKLPEYLAKYREQAATLTSVLPNNRPIACEEWFNLTGANLYNERIFSTIRLTTANGYSREFSYNDSYYIRRISDKLVQIKMPVITTDTGVFNVKLEVLTTHGTNIAAPFLNVSTTRVPTLDSDNSPNRQAAVGHSFSGFNLDNVTSIDVYNPATDITVTGASIGYRTGTLISFTMPDLGIISSPDCVAKLHHAGGTLEANFYYWVKQFPLAAITRFEPAEANVGDTVKIIGSNLSDIHYVAQDGKSVPFYEISDTELEMVVGSTLSHGQDQQIIVTRHSSPQREHVNYKMHPVPNLETSTDKVITKGAWVKIYFKGLIQSISLEHLGVTYSGSALVVDMDYSTSPARAYVNFAPTAVGTGKVKVIYPPFSKVVETNYNLTVNP